MRLHVRRPSPIAPVSPRCRLFASWVQTTGLLLALLILGAGVLQAAAPARPAAAGGTWPPGEAVRPQRVLPFSERASLPADGGHPVLGGFVDTHPAWRVVADPLTGSVDRAYGPGLSLAPGDDVRAAVQDWLREQPSLADVPVDQLQVEVLSGSGAPGRVRWLQLTQVHEGLPVLEATLTVAVRDGHVVYVAGQALAPVRAPSRPLLAPDAALQALERRLGRQDLVRLKEPVLAFAAERVGQGAAARLRHRLVWNLLVAPAGATAVDGWQVWIDARNGEPVEMIPEALHTGACEADTRGALGTVRGGIRPNRADDAEVSRVFPFVEVSDDGILKQADINGAYSFDGGFVSSRLDGEELDTVCQVCTEQPFVQADAGGRMDFGFGGDSAGSGVGSFVTGNGMSSPAGRSSYYHLAQARQMFHKWGVGDFPQIIAQVNWASFCNAISSRYLIQFFQEGNGCSNTGEIRDVIDHELGHNWDRLDGIDITSTVKAAMSEWKADMVALLMGGDSCIGESFYFDSNRWATAACSGVRDIDEKAAGRLDHVLTPSECTGCATLKRTANDCSASSTHCNGEITGQAVWHLYQNLITGVDYITGDPLPAGNPALTEAQARRLLEKWLLQGGPPMQNWQPDKSGISPYEAMTVEDDDDLDMSNGTPHAAYINAAFQHHEVAESALIPDSANCTAPPDPLVTATLELNPDTGRPRARIEWVSGEMPPSGTLTYDVLRNWRDGDAFLPLVQGVTAGPVFDENVGAGETLRYRVSAVAADGCGLISPGATVETLTVQQPAARVDSVVVTEVEGDGDGLLEPGETADVQVTLREAGGWAGMTGLTVVPESNDPHLLVSPGTSVSLPDLVAGGTSTGPAFNLTISPDALCPGVLFLPLSIQADEGCSADYAQIALGGTCDIASGAQVRVVEGSVAPVADNGDTDGMVDNCEVASYGYRLANVGDAGSGAVQSTVVSLTPGVQVVGGSSIHLGNIGPGEEAQVYFSVDALGLDPAQPVTLAVTADSVASAAPSTLEVTFAGEEDPTLYGTLFYDFESGEQGWTDSGFELSTVRPFSGLNSWHAGDINTPYLCQSLTSPVLRIDPDGLPTVTMQLWADIEPLSSSQWWDRANLHVIDVATGVHTLLAPGAGHLYNASSGLDGNLCHIDRQDGWGGSLNSFAQTDFNLFAWRGREIRLEINYASDAGDDREGIYVDDVTIIGASEVPADGQLDACVPVPEVAPAGGTVPLSVALNGGGVRLTWGDLAAGQSYNVYEGTLGGFYDHGTLPVACNSTGVTCDGSTCSRDTVPAAGNRYFLVTSSSVDHEGPAGFDSTGRLRDPQQDSCFP